MGNDNQLQEKKEVIIDLSLYYYKVLPTIKLLNKGYWYVS